MISFPFMHHYDWGNYVPQDRAVLCFLLRGDELLLIRKKRGLGAGKVNAPGGKQELGETLTDTAQRETREEVGLLPQDPKHHGTLRFAFADGYNLEVHIFLSWAWTGELIETEEAIPFWVTRSEIPYHEMWEDDRHWLPQVLAGHTVEAEMRFDGDRMLSWDLRFSSGDQLTGDLGRPGGF